VKTRTGLLHASRLPLPDCHQLLDINTKRLVPMCFGSAEWVDVCRQEFQKVLDAGADGMLYDECFHHVRPWRASTATTAIATARLCTPTMSTSWAGYGRSQTGAT